MQTHLIVQVGAATTLILSNKKGSKQKNVSVCLAASVDPRNTDEMPLPSLSISKTRPNSDSFPCYNQ